MYLISEIKKARKNGDYAIISNHPVKSFWFYGFFKSRIEGDESPEGGYIRPPILILTDEEGENEIYIRPKPWRTDHIEIINSAFSGDMFIVKGTFSFYEKDGEEKFSINCDSIITVPTEKIDLHRRILLLMMMRRRIGEEFKKESFLYNFLKSANLQMRENENSFSLIKKEDNIKDKKVIIVKKKLTKKTVTKSDNTDNNIVEKEKEITTNDIYNLIKQEKKISINDIVKRFSVTANKAWSLAIKTKQKHKNEIIVTDDDEETYLVLRG